MVKVSQLLYVDGRFKLRAQRQSTESNKGSQQKAIKAVKREHRGSQARETTEAVESTVHKSTKAVNREENAQRI